MDRNKHFCSECSHELIMLEGRFDDYCYCPECFNFEGIFRDGKDCCNKPDLEMVKHTISDGRFQIKKQCCNCGEIQGHCIPFKTVDNIEALPSSNRARQEIFQGGRSEELTLMRERVLKMFEEKFGVRADKKVGLLGYAQYLESPEWKEKRKLVLKRDRNICQSCLVDDATEVHHLTYKHVFNEPLFDLVAVCKPCHQSITDMDNKSNFKKIIHQNMLEEMLIRQFG